MNVRRWTGGAAALTVFALLAVPGSALVAQSTVPRTADGRPDLQGNWTNGTMTPIQRPEGVEPVLNAEQVAALESGRQDRIEAALLPSDPNREAPPVGGDGSTGAAGGVGGYNYFWIEAGDKVAIYNGEARSSLITHPANGRFPAPTADGQARLRERGAARRQFGTYDNPENRPLAERCLMSFGSNAGPPMLPNYFYNNNYTIVQTADHIMIHTEMVHDTRIIQMGEPRALPEHVRPWMGDSWGHWEGDTLVVETTNLPEKQIYSGGTVYPAASAADLRVVERFTRADETTINYEFTIIDETSYTSVYGGEVPFRRLDERLYEYACHEGNYALFNVLSGARAQEREGR